MPEGVTLHCGDCLAVMPAMPAASVDAVVCDPPYGLAFMGKAWDHGVPAAPFWAEALRVAKPGAHLIAFGGTRTFHRLACAIEDAGWIIRDCLMWLYGSGFPKSLDVSKAIDKAAGAEREIVTHRTLNNNRFATSGDGHAQEQYRKFDGNASITAPATADAKRWAGWGTALKPAWEPIIMARKPLIGTVADNVQRYGTGAINVDGCRINYGEVIRGGGNGSPGFADDGYKRVGRSIVEPHTLGRWPANLALDEEAAAALDAQTGACSGGAFPRVIRNGEGIRWRSNEERAARINMDTGGASRFFYTAKADADDRNDGCNGRNNHPTVKPIALMRWLVRLITYPGAIVLDPFMGSGSTGRAAIFEDCAFVGIDIDPAYVDIATARIAAAQRQPRLPIEERAAIDSQPAQSGLFSEGNGDA